MAALRARRDGRRYRACGGRGVRLQTHDCGRSHRHKRTAAIATEPRPGRVGSRAGRTRHSKRRSAVAAEPPPILVFTAAVGAGHRRLLSCLAGAKPTTSRLIAPLSPVVGLLPAHYGPRLRVPSEDVLAQRKWKSAPLQRYRVPRKGIEPLRPYEHSALNAACLPVPPPRPGARRWYQRRSTVPRGLASSGSAMRRSRRTARTRARSTGSGQSAQAIRRPSRCEAYRERPPVRHRQ
jgi:hypothetical protein